MNSLFSIDGRVAVMTGACGVLGETIVKHFAAEGCKVVLLDLPRTAEKGERIVAEIKAAGGLDIAVLGLGANAHIGYNEPAVPYDSLSHRQKLTDATKRQNAEVFGSEEDVPEYGYTMGIYTLVWATEIIVLAFGEAKADAVHKMLYGRDDSSVPAAFLQIPRDVTVYLDESLKKHQIVYPAAGSDHSAVRLSIAELEACSGAAGWVDVCKAGAQPGNA
jgi:6-phosphogluconolactonase/glucosamine-6-phosphate isomerase/deaminase